MVSEPPPEWMVIPFLADEFRQSIVSSPAVPVTDVVVVPFTLVVLMVTPDDTVQTGAFVGLPASAPVGAAMSASPIKAASPDLRVIPYSIDLLLWTFTAWLLSWSLWMQPRRSDVAAKQGIPYCLRRERRGGVGRRARGGAGRGGGVPRHDPRRPRRSRP